MSSAARLSEKRRTEKWSQGLPRLRTTLRLSFTRRARSTNAFTFAYLFAASEVRTGNAFALILPAVHTGAMQEFLDRAGWHGAAALELPDCITLVPLPAYSPELNPVERIWEHLKERYLSHRLLDEYDAIVEAASDAWNKLTAGAGRLTSLTWLPWVPKNGASQNL